MEAKEPGPATPTCTPPSTAYPAWPTPRPSMDEKASTTIGFFCRARASMASPGSCGSSPTTGRTTAPRASSRTSRPWPHAIRGSAPTPLHPTAQWQGRALQPHPGRGVPLHPHLHLTAAAPRRRRSPHPSAGGSEEPDFVHMGRL